MPGRFPALSLKRRRALFSNEYDGGSARLLPRIREKLAPCQMGLEDGCRCASAAVLFCCACYHSDAVLLRAIYENSKQVFSRRAFLPGRVKGGPANTKLANKGVGVGVLPKHAIRYPDKRMTTLRVIVHPLRQVRFGTNTSRAICDFS